MSVLKDYIYLMLINSLLNSDNKGSKKERRCSRPRCGTSNTNGNNTNDTEDIGNIESVDKIYADIALINGKIYTMNNDKIATAVAIKNNTIIFVGSNKGIKKHINNNTKVINLKNNVVLPAFHDTHIHALESGALYTICNISEESSIDGYKEVIKKYIEDNPEKDYIEGFGYLTQLMNDGTSKKEILDSVSIEKPIFIIADDGHSAWANSKALELANITKDTPDPVGGKFGKDINTGELTGILYEVAAMDKVHKVTPPLEDLKKGLLIMIEALNSMGVTSYIDARINEEQQKAYEQIFKEEELNARIQMSLYLDPEKADESIDSFANRINVNPNSRLQANRVKIFMDGVVENETANLIEPYVGTDSYGTEIFEYNKLKGYLIKLDNMGYRLHFHAIGDRAVKRSVDLIKDVENTNRKKDRRPIIAHISLISDDDKDRMRQIGAVAVLTFAWGSPIVSETEKILGQERYEKSYPFKSMIDAGVKISAGSDFAANVYLSPFMGIQVAATRQEPSEIEDYAGNPILNIKERITVKEAVEAYTKGGSYLMGLEKETGSIKVGKDADMIVIDRDIFNISPYKIGETKVITTIFRGKIVYENTEF